MKSFVFKLFLFSLPIAIFFASMEFLLRRIPNDYYYKKEYLDRHASEIQIINFGSSHAYYAINPEYFPKNAFNASHVAQRLDYDFEIFNKYKEIFNNLEIIILPISYFSFWIHQKDWGEAWRVKNYAIYYGIGSNSFINNFEILSISFSNNTKRLKRYYLNGENEDTSNSLGWGTAFKSEDAQDVQSTGIVSIREGVGDVFSEENIKTFNKSLKILNSFSEFCNQKNVKLIFLTIPCYDTYWENTDAVQRNKMFETINDFVREHSNCYYFNWSEDSDFVEKDFYNASHLNEIGAEKLTKKLNHAIDSLSNIK